MSDHADLVKRLASAMEHLELVAEIDAVKEAVAALEDAARWRALVGSARLHFMGSAGFDKEGKPREGHAYMHFGMEFWSSFTYRSNEKAELADPDNNYCRTLLTNYADAIIEKGRT